MLGRNVHYVTATRPVDSRRCIHEHLPISASSRRGSMSAIHTLGWTLMHSLWQDTLAAVGLAALLTVVPARAARSRYALSVATLLVMLALPVATGLRIGDEVAAGDRGHAARPRGLAAGARPSRDAAPRQPARTAGRVSVDTRARRHRLVAARDSHPGEPADGQRPHAAATRRVAGTRAGTCATARLPREPAAIGDRDALVLPSRGVVGLDARARGTRALLRRPGRRGLRGCALLRHRSARDGATARDTGARTGSERRLARRARPPPPATADG